MVRVHARGYWDKTRRSNIMKTLAAIAVAAVITVSAASWTHAADTGLMGIANATQSDFEDIKQNFRAAYRSGYDSWESYCRETGFSLEPYEYRITARRAALTRITDDAVTIEDAGRRGLLKMVVSDLDDLNLSLLMLIRDGNGYAGYISTGDKKEMVERVSSWQESVRTGLKEVRRTIRMVRKATGTTGVKATLIPPFTVH